MFVFFFCSLDRLRHLTTVSVWVTSRAWAGNFFFFLIFNFLPCDKESSVWVWTENWAGRKSKQMTVQRSGLRAPPSGSLLSQQQQAIRRTGSSVQMWKKIQSDNPGLLVWVLIWFRELIHAVNIPVAAAEHRGVVLRTRSRIFFFFYPQSPVVESLLSSGTVTVVSWSKRVSGVAVNPWLSHL